MSKSIGRYIQLQGGFAFKSSDFKESGIPLIRISNITENGLNKSEAIFLPAEYSNELKDFLAEENDTLIAMSGATTGKCCIIKANDLPCLINQRVGRFKITNEKEVDKLFVFHVVNSTEFKNELLKDAFGSAQPNVSPKDIEKVNWDFPSINEQSKIAKILSTADAVIEKTKAAIAKYKAIKQGMLQDLFTRGIDLTNNKLRPRYEDAPELYKESKLGMIPVAWEVERLEDTKVEILDGDRGVNYPKENDLKDSGYCLFLSATNVTKNGFKFSTMQFISKERDELLGTGKLFREDIIVTTRGTIGNVVYYGNEIPYNHIRINSGMILLRNNDPKIGNEYLYHFIKEILFEFHFKDSISGTAQPQLPIKDLKKLFLIYPKPEEQKLIAERIKAINKKLQSELTYLQKMQLLKKGLMEDLLSRRKQVKVEN